MFKLASKMDYVIFSGRIRSGQHDCSICLSEVTLAVETNCGHIFCGACMFTYYSLANSGKSHVFLD